MKRCLECELFNELDSEVIDFWTDKRLAPRGIINKLLTGKEIQKKVLDRIVYVPKVVKFDNKEKTIWFNSIQPYNIRETPPTKKEKEIPRQENLIDLAAQLNGILDKKSRFKIGF